MALSPRLRWRKWRLRNEVVPAYGPPLSVYEECCLDFAEFALRDEEGTRRVALDEEGAEILAAAESEGGWL